MKVINQGRVRDLELRDLFAAFALAGIASKPFGDGCPPDKAAEMAYAYADAALKERTRQHWKESQTHA